MARSPNLNGKAVALVVAAVRRMPDPVTWDGVVEAVMRETGSTYTRQALCRHVPVKAAYEARKGWEPAKPGAKRLSPAARVRRDALARLRAENDELKAKVWKLEEKFIVVTYNAWAENIDERLLYRPLPPLDRVGAKSSRERRTEG